MTAQTVQQPGLLPDIESAHDYVAGTAMRADTGGRVGLELEFHLVDLRRPQRRPRWAEVQALLAALPPLPSDSKVTVEPGGQLELSTPPREDATSAVAALRADSAALRSALRDADYGGAALGTDPARPLARINPHPRYAAMERHFAARGYGRSGAAMMTATAALQLNLDAGPAEGWRARAALLRSLTPVLIAVSATSSWLAGRSSGWQSMRQQTWQGVDRRRSDPIPAGDPGPAWADYALEAPVMLVRSRGDLRPITERIRFREWLADPGRIGRPAGLADLDYHLTTLFPPVRPRGYLEVRCLDAMPEAWWPGVVGFAVTLVDDPVAADAARDLCASIPGDAATAARLGLRFAPLAYAAARLAEVAVSRCAPGLRPEVEALASLLADGRTPGDGVRHRIEAVGPLRALEEEAHA